MPTGERGATRLDSAFRAVGVEGHQNSQKFINDVIFVKESCLGQTKVVWVGSETEATEKRSQECLMIIWDFPKDYR